VEMSSKDLMQLNNKLDKIIDTNNKAYNILGDRINSVKDIVIQLEEHQRAINGSIIRLQEEANNRSSVCSVKISNLERMASDNKGNIIKFQGMAIGLTLIVTLIGVALGAKNLGLW